MTITLEEQNSKLVDAVMYVLYYGILLPTVLFTAFIIIPILFVKEIFTKMNDQIIKGDTL